MRSNFHDTGIAGIFIPETEVVFVQCLNDGKDLPHHAAAFTALLAEVGHAGCMFTLQGYASFGKRIAGREDFSPFRAVYRP